MVDGRTGAFSQVGSSVPTVHFIEASASGVLEPGRTDSQEPIASLPNFSSVTSHVQPEIGPGVKIYTTEIRKKLYKSFYLLPPESLFLNIEQHTAYAYGNSLNKLLRRVLGNRAFC